MAVAMTASSRKAWPRGSAARRAAWRNLAARRGRPLRAWPAGTRHRAATAHLSLLRHRPGVTRRTRGPALPRRRRASPHHASDE